MPAAGFGSTPLQQAHRDGRPLAGPVARTYARDEGYAWGWQDARAELAGAAEATAFAHDDAHWFAELLTQQPYFVHSVGEAWRTWRESGGLAVTANQAAR
ncbi:hypothetical protein [Nocardia brasiliensis]|uniref:hypothetical protein n=1 Tax=Nocardia brasiliensis TaxID=37326 RepID=UPI003D90B86F